MPLAQQSKIALPLGRTHINLRFKATNEEVGSDPPRTNTLHNYLKIKGDLNTLHNYLLLNDATIGTVSIGSAGLHPSKVRENRLSCHLQG